MKTFIISVCFLVQLTFAAPTLKIQGSTTVNPVVSEAAETFRQKGWKIVIDTQGGSTGGINALAEKQVDLAMSSKPIGDSDRKNHPNVGFISHAIGMDGVALVVSRKVYDGGVKALSKDQIIKIYEGQLKRWSEVGGPNLPIIFFNKEPGRGTWEVFANYLYGKAENAPLVTHAEVGSNEEARTKVAGHASAVTQLSAAWIEGNDHIRAVAIKTERGIDVLPTSENIHSGKYPMTRPLLIVSAGEALGPSKEFIEYLKSTAGQSLLVRNGYLPYQ